MSFSTWAEVEAFKPALKLLRDLLLLRLVNQSFLGGLCHQAGRLRYYDPVETRRLGEPE